MWSRLNRVFALGLLALLFGGPAFASDWISYLFADRRFAVGASAPTYQNTGNEDREVSSTQYVTNGNDCAMHFMAKSTPFTSSTLDGIEIALETRKAVAGSNLYFTINGTVPPKWYYRVWSSTSLCSWYSWKERQVQAMDMNVFYALSFVMVFVVGIAVGRL